jgi:hypothetical protein
MRDNLEKLFLFWDEKEEKKKKEKKNCENCV